MVRYAAVSWGSVLMRVADRLVEHPTLAGAACRHRREPVALDVGGRVPMAVGPLTAPVSLPVRVGRAGPVRRGEPVVPDGAAVLDAESVRGRPRRSPAVLILQPHAIDPSAVSAPSFGARRPNLRLRANAVAGIRSQELLGTGNYFRLDVRVGSVDVPTDPPFCSSQCSRPAHSRVLGRSARDHRPGRLGPKGGLEALLLCRATRSNGSCRRLRIRQVHVLSRTYVRFNGKTLCVELRRARSR